MKCNWMEHRGEPCRNRKCRYHIEVYKNGGGRVNTKCEDMDYCLLNQRSGETWTYMEIAEVMGVSFQNIQQMEKRILKKLSKNLTLQHYYGRV